MSKLAIKEMSQARFAALTFATNSYYPELAWFSDADEHFLAAIVIDYIDEDYHYVILARDEANVFRCIATGESFENFTSAISALFIQLDKYIQTPQKIYPQGESSPRRYDIFEPPIGKKLNKNYLKLKNMEKLSAAKELIREITRCFIEAGDNFFKHFQLDGFDQRLWELYLYAYLHEELFTFDRNYNSPDYVCIKENNKICIEATTINPPENETNENPSIFDMFTSNSEYNCIKFKRALCKKLYKVKRYWNLPHVKGYPFILAIQSFENFGDCTSVIKYLYGISHSWEKDDQGNLIITPQKIDWHTYKNLYEKSGFFSLPESQNISAVLFSNSGTTSKFNRMGKLACFGSPRVHLWRIGTCLNHDPNATLPKPFAFEIEPGKYHETWAQGLSMMHNPNAFLPVDPKLFPNVVHHFFDKGQIITRSNQDFHPLTSVTLNILEK